MTSKDSFQTMYKSNFIGHHDGSHKKISVLYLKETNFCLFFNKRHLNYGYALLTTLLMIKTSKISYDINQDLKKQHSNFISKYLKIYSLKNSKQISKLNLLPNVSSNEIVSEDSKISSDYNVLENYAKLHKSEYFSVGINIINNNINYYIYNFIDQKTFILDNFAKGCIPHKHMPCCISIDSEFVDKNNDNYCVYENIRINIPLSVGVQITFFNNINYKIYKTYVFDINHYEYLKQQNNNVFLKESLEHIHYKPSKDYNITDYEYNKPMLINDDNIFKRVIHKEILNNVCKIDSDNPLLYFIPNECLKNVKNSTVYYFPIIFYFSIKDLKYFFSCEIYEYIEKFFYTQRSVLFNNFTNISPFGFYYKDSKTEMLFKIKLIDLCGLNKSGLNNLANSTNTKIENKDSLNEYKVDMRDAIYKKPCTFMEYQYNDVNCLFNIYVNYINIIHTMYKEFNINTLPTIFSDYRDLELKQTIGSITANLFESFIYNKHPLLKNTINKIGISIERENLNYKDINLIEGLEMGSAKYLNHLKGSAVEATFVSGGRCCNETPFNEYFKNVLDIDFESCYGTSLRNLMYPIGRPHVLRNPDGGFTCTLKEFIKTYKKDLIPGCWYAVVSTKNDETLNFNFDLIISKIITTKSIQSKIDQPDSMAHNMHLSGDQAIFTNKIRHGVITDDSLEIINKIATNIEKKELYNKIHIICACFYPKSMQCNSIEEFTYKINAQLCQNKLKKNKKSKKNKYILNDSKNDKMPMYWYGIEMEHFIGKLVDKRNQLKKLYKKTKSLEDNALQTNLKTIINTLYGVTASRFFKISNLTFANNVTNTARSQSWLLSKCFNTKQIITDGGLYEINKVLNLDSFRKNPGFNKLYEIHISQNSKDIKYFKSLGNDKKNSFDWDDTFKNLNENPSNSNFSEFAKKVDLLANQHFQNFCLHFEIKTKYKLEHKIDNTSNRAVIIGRGHYYMDTINNGNVFKIRGTQPCKDKESIESPIYTILKNRMYIDRDDNKIFVLKNLCYTNRSLIKTFNLNAIKKKLGNSFKNNDFSLHSSVIAKKTYCYNLDTGKFDNDYTYKNFKSSYGDFLTLSFLDDKCILKAEKNELIIDAIAFWKNYQDCINKLNSSKTLMRVSKNHNNQKNKWIKNAYKVDPFFPLEIKQVKNYEELKHNAYHYDVIEVEAENEIFISDNEEETFF